MLDIFTSFQVDNERIRSQRSSSIDTGKLEAAQGPQQGAELRTVEVLNHGWNTFHTTTTSTIAWKSQWWWQEHRILGSRCSRHRCNHTTTTTSSSGGLPWSVFPTRLSATGTPKEPMMTTIYVVPPTSHFMIATTFACFSSSFCLGSAIFFIHLSDDALLETVGGDNCASRAVKYK